MSKRKWLVVGVSSFLAIVLGLFLLAPRWEPGNLPSEPPIFEQINAQLAALKKGDPIPLPIPILVGGEEIKVLTIGAIREAMRQAGWTEINQDNIGGFSKEVQKQAVYMGNAMFIAPDEKVIVKWKDISIGGRSHIGISIFPAQRGASAGELDDMQRTKLGSYVRLRGDIEIGMDVDELRADLKGVLHEYKDMRRGRNPKEVIILSRGVYMYLLSFRDGRLSFISVSTSYKYHRDYVQQHSEDESVKELRRWFGIYTIRERIEELLWQYGVIRP